RRVDQPQELGRRRRIAAQQIGDLLDGGVSGMDDLADLQRDDRQRRQAVEAMEVEGFRAGEVDGHSARTVGPGPRGVTAQPTVELGAAIAASGSALASLVVEPASLAAASSLAAVSPLAASGATPHVPCVVQTWPLAQSLLRPQIAGVQPARPV